MRHLLLLGVSHHTAPVDVREQVDFARAGLLPALQRLSERPEFGEAVVLSTCNRAEIYASCADVSLGCDALADFLSSYHAVPTDALRPHLYTRTDEDVARHLFRVAAGLDSLVVGEPQILGQVKAAYTTAAENHHTGALLNRLFHASFTVGKRVRTQTGLAEGAVSVSYAAVAMARKIFGKLDNLSVLVLGAGEIGKLTAQHLQAQHVHRMTITSRTGAHAERLAAQIGGTAVAWNERHLALASADIVVAATGAPEPIVTRAHVEEAMRSGRSRPLFLIDIAVPRDIEPAAGALEQVFLYNIDDLKTIVFDNVSRRTAQVDHAEALVADEVKQFSAWFRSRDAIPTVVALRQRFESIRRGELKRLEPKIAELPPEARARVDEITRLIVEKLLLTPTEQLKALSDHETVMAYSDALSRLFSLAAEEDAARNDARDADATAEDRGRIVAP